MRALALLLLLSGCSWGPAVFDCDEEMAKVGMAEAIHRWPDVEPVVQRLDVFCVSRFDIQSIAYCGRSGARDIDACTMKIGSSLGRARIYVADDVPVDAAVVHEMQHAHLWGEPDACASHSPACGWEEL